MFVLISFPVLVFVGFLWLLWQGVLFVFELLRDLAQTRTEPVRSDVWPPRSETPDSTRR